MEAHRSEAMIYVFGSCQIDEERHELQRDAERVEIQPKAFELLRYLVEHRDRVVPKDELLEALWSDASVTEASLTRAVNLVRNALGDAGPEHRFVRTFPRRGYRFAAEVEPRGDALPEALVAARLACDAHAWETAVANFGEAEKSARLDARDLERLAFALRWAERDDASAEVFGRAHAAFDDAGDRRGAARAALELVYHHFTHGDLALAGGWLRRAERDLAAEEECAEQGLLLWQHARAARARGDLAETEDLCERTIALGRSVGSRDVEALGLLDLGLVRIEAGRVREGVALHEEACALAMGGEVGLQAAGIVYCGAIWGSRNVGDWERASEWTNTSLRWCERVRVAAFPGLCRYHRAEVLRHRGEFEAAEREVLAAIDDLSIHMQTVAGDGWYELGEIRMRRGDLRGAREAFQRTVELGREPEPGLARLLQLEGDASGALQGLARAGESTAVAALARRVGIRTTEVSLALAVGDRERATRALAALDEEPERWESPAYTAAVECARGELALAEGRARDAVRHLQRSVEGWSEVGSPWEAATAQVRLAEALVAEGDAGAAQLRLGAARAAFERMGCARDVRACAAREAPLAARSATDADSQRSCATFLFTDMVGSTQLAELLGDEDWEALRRWHHRTLQACFHEYAGQVVGPHEGDGFFVAFADVAAAIECGLAIQEKLRTHRREHGFAPRVRVGAHSAEALRRGGDYSGVGVHVAARIASAAEAGEVLVSAATRNEAPGFRFGDARRVEVAEGSEPVEAHSVRWLEET